jgi:protein phosphatase
MLPGASGIVRPALAWAAATDVGRRERNEDAHGGEARIDPQGAVRGLFVVCDGVGGHADGEAASALGVSVARQELGWTLEGEWPAAPALFARVNEAIARVNQAIFELNERTGRQDRGRAGTTFALLLVTGAQACVAHVGDSRIYALTAADVTLLTRDHNVANREVRHGTPPEIAWQRPDARHLVQALGPFSADHVQPDVTFREIAEPTVFVLCSDGVSDGGLMEREAAARLAPILAGDVSVEDGCRGLVDVARRSNGHDNATAIVVRVDPHA